MTNGNFGLTGLSSLGTLTVVNGLWFNSKSFNIDGYRFINCRFDNCKLSVMSTNFEIVDCYVDHNTQILYGPENLKIVRLWNSRNNDLYACNSVFAPKKNSDGTITISGVVQ